MVAEEFPASCRYCAAPESKLHLSAADIRGQTFHYHRCQQCRAVYIYPFPTEAVLRGAYDDSYYGAHPGKFAGPVERVLDGFRRSRARRAKRLLEPNDLVVDVGCGNGRFLGYLAQMGQYRLVGIELPGKAADRAAQIPGIQLKRGQLKPSDFEPGSVALATLFHVFEHLENPRATLITLAAMIRPGGHLLVSFPNIDSWQVRIFRNHWLHLDPPRHLCFLGPKAFEKEAALAGFDIVHSRYFSIEQNPFGWVQSLFNACGLPRDLLYERLKGNSAYAPNHGRRSILVQKLAAAALAPIAVALDLLESMIRRGATVEFLLRRR